LCLLSLSIRAGAQTAATLNLYPPANPAQEQTDLNQAVSEANGSASEITRNLEQHLRKYPDSPQRASIEASLYKTATENNDRARIITYGEKLLAAKPNDELEILDRVIRALLTSDDAESAQKAMAYVKRYKLDVEVLRLRPPEGHATAAQWADLADRALARVAVLEARAAGNLGNFEDAVAAARQSWNAMPSAEAAHEMARWLVKMNREAEALEHFADAAMLDDARRTASERDRDRAAASAIYVKLHSSEQGLGDVFLQAWDRCGAALRDRTARYKAKDRNYNLTNAFEFVLPAAAEAPSLMSSLDMAKLTGKTVVMDFWATWCGPCVAQHPLIERVRQKYAQNGDVVFLSLNSDDDHSLIEPFLKAQKWNERVYLESGLAGLLNVTSLPTTLVIDPTGKIYSRLLGFNGESWEHTLSARIDEARAATPK
jgi:thiol-disulfide isomerase/thioredoxin